MAQQNTPDPADALIDRIAQAVLARAERDVSREPT
jgi:hypothetical protein